MIWEKTGVDLFCRKQVKQSDVGYAVATFTYWFKIALSLNPELVFRVDRDEDDAKLSDFLGRPVARAPSLDRNSRPKNRFEGFEPEMLARIPGRLRDDFAEVTGALGYPEDADVITSFG